MLTYYYIMIPDYYNVISLYDSSKIFIMYFHDSSIMLYVYMSISLPY